MADTELWDELDEAQGTGESCYWCGAPLKPLDFVEIWPSERAFQLESCCEGRHEELLDELQEALRMPAPERRRYLQPLRDLLQAYGVPCRQVYGSWTWGAVRIDFGLELGQVPQAEAKAFIRQHHRHNAPPAGWRWGSAVRNGQDVVAVGWVGRPVARKIPPGYAVEVNRVCVDPGLDPELVWNACSMLYGQAAREAKRRGYARIVTYTLESEDATTLRAAGWVQLDSKLEPVELGSSAAVVKGRTWDRAKRHREDKAPTCNKIRWGRVLAK